MTINKTDNASASDSGTGKQHSGDNSSLQRKVVIRRLPPTMTKEQFLDICSPLPEYDYMYFCKADNRLV